MPDRRVRARAGESTERTLMYYARTPASPPCRDISQGEKEFARSLVDKLRSCKANYYFNAHS